MSLDRQSLVSDEDGDDAPFLSWSQLRRISSCSEKEFLLVDRALAPESELSDAWRAFGELLRIFCANRDNRHAEPEVENAETSYGDDRDRGDKDDDADGDDADHFGPEYNAVSSNPRLRSTPELAEDLRETENLRKLFSMSSGSLTDVCDTH